MVVDLGSSSSSTEDKVNHKESSKQQQQQQQQQQEEEETTSIRTASTTDSTTMLQSRPSIGFQAAGASIRNKPNYYQDDNDNNTSNNTKSKWNSSESQEKQVHQVEAEDLNHLQESWMEQTMDDLEAFNIHKVAEHNPTEKEWVEERIEDKEEEDEEEEDEEEEDEDEEEEVPQEVVERGIYRKLSGDLLGAMMMFAHNEQHSSTDVSCITTHEWGDAKPDEEDVAEGASGVASLQKMDLHKYIQSSDWKGLAEALTELEEQNNPKLFQKIVLRRNKRQETALHVVCCKSPTPLALQLLLALHDLHLAHSLLTTTFDAQENTVMHMVCAHTTSTERKQQQQPRTSKKSKSSSSRKSGKSKKSSKTASSSSVALKSISESEELTESTANSDSSSGGKLPAIVETALQQQQQQQQRPDTILDFTILKNLVLLAPEVLEMTNQFGDTPLHLLVTSPGFRACKYKNSSGETTLSAEMAAEEAIVSLLDVVPLEIAQQPNHQGLTLLHCAIAEGAHERVLVQLLRRLPQAAATPDARGMYALHYAAVKAGHNHKSESLPWTFAQDLIERYPQALVEQEYENGNSPLHLLLSKIQSKKKSQMKKDRKHAKKSNKKSKSSSKSKAKDFVILRNTIKMTELLARPTSGNVSSSKTGSALKLLNKEQLSPLHCCAGHSDITPESLTKLLVDVAQKFGLAESVSVMQTSSFGSTPLHLACAQEPADVAAVQALASVPQACAVQDCRGRTPLAVAILNPDVSTSVVKALLSAYPEAAEIPCHGNYLPLHLAVQAQVKESIYRHLIKASNGKKSMNMLEATTVNGDTPLHVACSQEGMSKHVVKLMLDQYPEAIFLRNNAGKSPYDLALTFNRSLVKSLPQLEVAAPIPELTEMNTLVRFDTTTKKAISAKTLEDIPARSTWASSKAEKYNRRKSDGGILRNC